VDFYLANILTGKNSTADNAGTLYIIFIGSNDYLTRAVTAPSDIDTDTTAVINVIQEQVYKLILLADAKNFLFVGVPDFNLTPFGREMGPAYGENLHDFAVMHNQKLTTLVQQLQSTFASNKFMLLEINETFQEAINFPKKFGLTNVTAPCDPGGIDPGPVALQPLQPAMSSLVSVINQNPVLRIANNAAYYQQQYEAAVCTNQNQYLFWDYVHPTTAMHQIIGQIAYSLLQANGFS